MCVYSCYALHLQLPTNMPMERRSIARGSSWTSKEAGPSRAGNLGDWVGCLSNGYLE